MGVVQDGQFKLLAPCTSLGVGSVVTLTQGPPEAAVLNLTPYEGQVIVVRGHDKGDLIWSAAVAEISTPLIAKFILKCYLSPTLCEVCLQKLNSATQEDSEEIEGVDKVLSKLLEDAKPFQMDHYCCVCDIERLLDDNVPGIGEVLRRRIVRHFCPELYE